MTVGSAALMLMEKAPIRPPITHLAAIDPSAGGLFDLVTQTRASLKKGKWRNILIHTSAEGLDPERECHFIVSHQTDADGSNVRATVLWSTQQQGNHGFLPVHDYNADSIAVFVTGDFSSQGPSRQQFQALLDLARTLQQACGITADRVYLYNHIDPRSGSPGAAFPADEFRDGLLRPSR
jgi:hypothetical protein